MHYMLLTAHMKLVMEFCMQAYLLIEHNFLDYSKRDWS